MTLFAPSDSTSKSRRASSRVKLVFAHLEVRMLGLALVLAIVLSLLSPYFLKTANLLNLLDQSVVVGIVAIGMTFVILTGGIDLSVGSVAGLTGVILGLALQHFNIPISVALAVASGAAIGLFSGALIAYFNLAAFVIEIVNGADRGILFRAHVARPVARRRRHDHGARRHHGCNLHVVGVEPQPGRVLAQPSALHDQRDHVGRGGKLDTIVDCGDVVGLCGAARCSSGADHIWINPRQLL